jgi:uncharacterized membrane protein
MCYLTYSKIPAAPIPTPIHMVTIPYRVSGRFFISDNKRPTNIAPVAPSGCVNDIDLVELNEAFASQTLASMREVGLDAEKTNVNGGAIALGSTKSISLTSKLACSNTSGIAYAGPIPINLGSTPTALNPTKRE